MTDELEKLFRDLRARTLNEIVAPGAAQARATVWRRRRVVASAGAGVGVATVLIGAAAGLHPGGGGDYVAGDPGGTPSGEAPSGEVLPVRPGPTPSGEVPPVLPEPSGPAYDAAQAAGDLLADRQQTPTSISATNGVVSSAYEDHMNDMPADTYLFRFFCVGTGVVDVVVKQGDSGDTVLGHGTATCAAHDPTPLRLTIRQPTYGYLRIFAAGDARSNDRAGFAFEFLSTTGKTVLGPSGLPRSFPSVTGSSIERPSGAPSATN
jgi:hypothetical protein